MNGLHTVSPAERQGDTPSFLIAAGMDDQDDYVKSERHDKQCCMGKVYRVE